MKDGYLASKPWVLRLVDEGYDMWMQNFRGTKYSQQHVSLENTSFEYWDFSVEELGLYDTPAVIDVVYEHNGGEKIILLD